MIIPLLSIAARRCPFVLQKRIAERVLDDAFAEARKDGELEFLADREVGMDITDIGYRVTLGLNNGRLCLLPGQQAPEALIRGDLSAFIQLATRKQDPDTLFFQRRLCLEGDTELGLEVKNLIDSIDLTTLPQWMQKGIRLADHFDQHLLAKTI